LEVEERNFRDSLWRSKEAHSRQVIEEMDQNNIWPVTKWWQGNRWTITPALRGAEGVKITDPAEKAKLLHRAWFPLPGDRSVALAVRLRDNLVGPTQDICEDWMPCLIKAFLKLSARKAPGISGIKYMHYRELDDQTVARILSIIQGHLSMGTSPQVWKEQIVTVLAKPDRPDYSIPKVYRPISLLECLSKTAERACTERMKEHVLKWNLASAQHVAKRGQGTETTFAVLASELAKGKRAGIKTAILKFDIQGFFDNIHQPTLVCIMKKLGFARDIVLWIQQHIAKRTFHYRIDGNVVWVTDHNNGIPQGSPLSPLLAVIYTHYMESYLDVQGVSLIMYMDDGLLVVHKKTIFQSIKALSLSLKWIELWAKDHKIRLDGGKTEFLFLARKNKEYKKFGLTNQKTLTWLGVTFDSNMSWAPHLKKLAMKAGNKVLAIRLAHSVKGGMRMSLTKKLINAYILPTMTYGQIMWRGAGEPTVGSRKWLEVTLNQAVGAALSTFRSTSRDMNLWLIQQPSMAHALQKLWDASLLRIGQMENRTLRGWLDEYSNIATDELIEQKDPAAQAVCLFREKGWAIHMEPMPVLKAEHLYIQAAAYAAEGPEELPEGTNEMPRASMRKEWERLAFNHHHCTSNVMKQLIMVRTGVDEDGDVYFLIQAVNAPAPLNEVLGCIPSGCYYRGRLLMETLKVIKDLHLAEGTDVFMVTAPEQDLQGTITSMPIRAGGEELQMWWLLGDILKRCCIVFNKVVIKNKKLNKHFRNMEERLARVVGMQIPIYSPILLAQERVIVAKQHHLIVLKHPYLSFDLGADQLPIPGLPSKQVVLNRLALGHILCGEYYQKVNWDCSKGCDCGANL
jgi:hypothetical protein